MKDRGIYVGQLVVVRNGGKGLPKALQDLAGKKLLVVRVEQISIECNCGVDPEFPIHRQHCATQLEKMPTNYRQRITVDVDGTEQPFGGGHFVDATTENAAVAA